MILRILPSAIADLQEGVRFYEEKEDGLGRYFFESVTADLRSLMTTGGVHRKFRGFHRFVCKVFPYAAYYLVENDTVVIWRVLDCRQNPRRIARSLRGLIP
jgi:plasmid stabilization system protein ParE